MCSSAIREDRFMTVTFGGIAPTVVTETTYLQYTEHVEREKDGGIVRGHGVCLTLVFDWVAKCKLHGTVSAASELKSGLSLTLAHTNYLLDQRGMKESEGAPAISQESHSGTECGRVRDGRADSGATR
jgi:hypothetical protein